jgi:hypothetical protein
MVARDPWLNRASVNSWQDQSTSSRVDAKEFFIVHALHNWFGGLILNENHVTPLMLRSAGRSGSTMLMQLLGTSEQIFMEKEYPFEVRYLSYLHRLIYQIKQPCKNDDKWNPDSLFNQNITRVGAIPWGNVSILDQDRLATSVFRQAWKAFSQELRMHSNNQKSDKVFYYAEKVVPIICFDVNAITEAKNLFLFRDPRDEFLSIKSFNAKRKYLAFGWTSDDDDISFAKKLASQRRDFMRLISKIEIEDTRRHLVIYENIIRNPYAETQMLSRWLGVDLNWDNLSANMEILSVHATTNSLDQSVERWKKELSNEINQVFCDVLGDELQQLGYDLE